MTQFTITRRAALGGFAAVAAFPSLAGGRTGGEVKVGTGRMTVEGRYAFGPSGAIRLGYPGVALRMIADTPQLAMRVNASSADVFLSILVDDEAPRRVRLDKGQQDLTLFEDAPGKHRVQIVRRTESWQGTMDVLGFGQPGKGAVAPMPLPDRRLTFIGDSITCGAGEDAAMDYQSDGPETSDGSRAYGRLLAAKFGASCHLVSYGGKGLIRDWQGKPPPAEPTAPIFYERAMPDDPTTQWNHRSYVPHAIGVCLGTNDFNQGVPEREVFVGAYVAFARKLMHDAPGATILLIDSPMTDDNGPDHKRSVQIDYLQDTVKRLGTPRVVRAPLSHQPGRPTNSHPIYPQHIAMAAELEPPFRAATGWTG